MTTSRTVVKMLQLAQRLPANIPAYRREPGG
jgi:hypothetical protein